MKVMELPISGTYRFLQCDCGSIKIAHLFNLESSQIHEYRCIKCGAIFESNLNYPHYNTIDTGAIREVILQQEEEEEKLAAGEVGGD